MKNSPKNLRHNFSGDSQSQSHFKLSGGYIEEEIKEEVEEEEYKRKPKLLEFNLDESNPALMYSSLRIIYIRIYIYIYME